ncbi:MAG: hydrolase TatD [Candidatus Nealsonbacteria bacterium CG11_big_fil_rev_8_21_14_0_20_35_11]|uniref:Hydrolase TatD n=1 Tax=Candidatus Nealsonbacteria bacterium CG11_big_fil_rev_8_21_14_0_20_35_11 TaxID=1974713 RepID=A0A2H0MZF3_9BACT|nr:MAG: hydrolase TatD [Candidatus Nealsonbacteria bacterium CG11_big_fil_rev_8_21_14_0_20_35_11]
MLIDTHAHLNFAAFEKDVKKIIQRSVENDVWMINIGTQYNTSERAVEIADGYKKGVYAAIGLHPLHLEEQKLDKSEVGFLPKFKTRSEEFDYERYKKLAQSEKVIAVGEIGLDYYYKPKTKRKLEIFKQKQREALLNQLRLAQELDLPVIFHCRMAHDDLIQTIKQFNNLTMRGTIHCFTGNWEQAEEYMNMGFYLGFNGIIFKLNLDEIIRKTPLDKILVETDCPYLTPSPMTGRNEPLYVKYVAEKIAKIKNLSFEEIAKITTQNAKKSFKINQ